MSHGILEGEKTTPRYCKGIVVEALRCSFMDFQLSCTSRLPWIWVVEALAHSNQVDISLLVDLLEKTPEISDDLGKNAREVVSLKILERFFTQGTPANLVSSASSVKIKLDPSDSCEVVLQRILAEASPTGLKPSDLEMAKWDLQPFIQHKRSNLTIYTLQQLKDAILTGKNSLPASLIERSGLPVGNQPEHRVQTDGGNCNGCMTRLEGNGTDHVLLHRDLPNDNLLSVSRKRKVSNENPGGASCENQTNNGTFKKHKHDVMCSEKEQAPHYDAKLPNNKSDGDLMQGHEVRLDKFEQNVPRNAPNVGEAEEDDDISSDSDGFHDEETSIDTKKKSFLSSQCTYSQDSLATTNGGAPNLCMKCRKGGESLVCSSDSCPIVIHERCLGSDVTYETSGKFYCPFCAYSQAISKYMAIKRKTSLARKDLTSFMCVQTEKESKKESHRLCRTKQNHKEPDDGLPRSNKVKRNAEQKVSNCQPRKELENEQAGPSKLHSDYNLQPTGKAVASTNRIVDQALDKDKREEKKTTKVTRSLRFHENRQTDELATHKSLEENASCHENYTDIRSNKEARCPPDMDIPHEQEHSSKSQSVDSEETSDEEYKSKSPGASKYYKRVRKREMHNSYPAIPQMRRKKLPWSTAEEDALKAGIRLFSNPNLRIMPWTKILEFGAGVFDKTRTAVDLKDKWRNMCRAGSKP